MICFSRVCRALWVILMWTIITLGTTESVKADSDTKLRHPKPSKHHRPGNETQAEDELCFAVVGDIGGLPKPPFQTFAQKKVANLLAKVGKLKFSLLTILIFEVI